MILVEGLAQTKTWSVGCVGERCMATESRTTRKWYDCLSVNFLFLLFFRSTDGVHGRPPEPLNIRTCHPFTPFLALPVFALLARHKIICTVQLKCLESRLATPTGIGMWVGAVGVSARGESGNGTASLDLAVDLILNSQPSTPKGTLRQSTIVVISIIPLFACTPALSHFTSQLRLRIS
ncbi:hypothetical protein BJ165DRAFT_415194 [Panaeolus papilionaceus]|nr:hypothetical protein BJ165DRAFT_415194 [Panaeolus papilionaceus]